MSLTRYARIQLVLFQNPTSQGKFHLIMDLSASQGDNIHDSIDARLCSLQYTSVKQAAKLVKCLGPGTLMAKLDFSSAYRQFPVHPDDQCLLGLEWQGVIY